MLYYISLPAENFPTFTKFPSDTYLEAWERWVGPQIRTSIGSFMFFSTRAKTRLFYISASQEVSPLLWMELTPMQPKTTMQFVRGTMRSLKRDGPIHSGGQYVSSMVVVVRLWLVRGCPRHAATCPGLWPDSEFWLPTFWIMSSNHCLALCGLTTVTWVWPVAVNHGSNWMRVWLRTSIQ